MSKKFLINYSTYNTTISATRGGILHTLGFYCGKNVYGGVEDSNGGEHTWIIDIQRGREFMRWGIAHTVRTHIYTVDLHTHIDSF